MINLSQRRARIKAMNFRLASRALNGLLALLVLTSCEGPEGPMGPAGAQGGQGEQGERGPTGSRGSRGTQGDDGVAVYLADFANESDISFWSFKGGSHRIEQQRLILRGGESTLAKATSSLQFEGNMDITATAEWLTGVDNNAFGLLFHVSDDGFYGFGISGNGGFILSRWDSGVPSNATTTPIDLIEWTGSALINQRAANALRVVVVEDAISLYINDIQVAEIDDSTYRSGSVGLYVGSNQEIAFDNLFVQPITTSLLR